jgi:SAM-dependent methyltransferase
MSPPCENFLTADDLDAMEAFYPLHVRVCERCFLVQLREYIPPSEIFSEYAYFSSYSESWIRHAYDYADAVTSRFSLSDRSLVVEVASNDGYLLQHFVTRGIPVLGIEPARNVARAATERGVPTLVEFFGRDVAKALTRERGRADLVAANNVLAQVPDLNDFVAGFAILLAPDGVATFEFPHLMRLIDENQFDTIYHEHFSYFSFLTAREIFEEHGLRVFDVDSLSSHGGSLRLYVCHRDGSHSTTSRVAELARLETEAGYRTLEPYRGFASRIEETKRALLEFLIRAKRAGDSVVGYGAPGKGNTLLNYCGIRTDLLEYTVDRNPYKHGRFLPGTHIPVFEPERLNESRPAFILILPWNLRKEIAGQLSYARAWGARFVVAIPQLEVFD